jgi:hypothetical protein
MRGYSVSHSTLIETTLMGSDGTVQACRQRPLLRTSVRKFIVRSGCCDLQPSLGMLLPIVTVSSDE